jgi:hypothetical protein
MPFHLLSTLQRGWLLVLLLLWAAMLFGGFLLGPTRENRRIPRWARMGSSFMLVLAAWSWWLFGRETPAAGYALGIAVGMTLGLVGDLALAELLGFHGTKRVISGMAAFAAGHVCYILAIVYAARLLGLTSPAALWGSLALAWLLVLAGWWLVVMRGQPRPTLIHKLALPYAWLLATTAGLAAGLALQQPTFLVLALGAWLFLISDLILAGALFSDLRVPLIHDIVWLTYGPGQMLIVMSTGAVLALVI